MVWAATQRRPLLGTSVRWTSENATWRHFGQQGLEHSPVGYTEPLWGKETLPRGKEYAPMSEQAKQVKHKGKDSGIVRFTFEMIEGLKIVEEEESADSQE